jgi:hypothetical protein
MYNKRLMGLKGKTEMIKHSRWSGCMMFEFTVLMFLHPFGRVVHLDREVALYPRTF